MKGIRGRYEMAILRVLGGGPADGMLVWMGGVIKLGRRYVTIMPIAPQTLTSTGALYRIPWHRVYEIVTYESDDKFVDAFIANYQEGMVPVKAEKTVGYG